MSDKDWFESMPSPFDKPTATVHGTGSGKPLCKGPVDSDGYHCICSNYHEHNGKCRHHNQVFHNMPTPSASPTVTLQRWSFVTDDRTGSPVAFPNPNGQWVKYDDALALLRAAEKK